MDSGTSTIVFLLILSLLWWWNLKNKRTVYSPTKLATLPTLFIDINSIQSWNPNGMVIGYPQEVSTINWLSRWIGYYRRCFGHWLSTKKLLVSLMMEVYYFFILFFNKAMMKLLIMNKLFFRTIILLLTIFFNISN